MKFMNIARRFLAPVSAVGAAALAPVVAHATLVSDATTAVQAAAADGLTVGGAVVAGVAALVVVGLVIGVVKKI